MERRAETLRPVIWPAREFKARRSISTERRRIQVGVLALACIFVFLIFLGYNDETLDEHSPYKALGAYRSPALQKPQTLAARDLPEFAGLLIDELQQFRESVFTLFVPSDLALISLAHQTWGDTGDWRNVRRLLPLIFPYYTVHGRLFSADVSSRQPLIVPALNGHPLLLQRHKTTGVFTVNGTTVIDADLVALGTIAHKSNGLEELVPSSDGPIVVLHFLNGPEIRPGIAAAVRLDAVTPGRVIRVNGDAAAHRTGQILGEAYRTAEDLEEEAIVAEYLFERAEVKAGRFPEVDKGES